MRFLYARGSKRDGTHIAGRLLAMMLWMKNLYTIGYEGADLHDFIATLKANKVGTLLDVRELPISRRKGFSKAALQSALLSEGINYRHERSLGSPKTIRHQLHSDGDYVQFFRSFTNYLESQTPLLERLATEIKGGVALMCFERDPATCHRSVVAKQLQTITSLSVKHLGVRDGIGIDGARARVGEGVPTA